jgi:A/G-specific adenine glycosylase
MKQTRLKQTAEAVIAWYAQHKRDLPWRQGKDPYRIWIAEIMLQQTRIETVIPYYGRFLEELPDLAALASVPEDRLLKLWEGLGYYSRARNLKKAAQTVQERYGGVMPRTAAELKKLPGIGEYTAGSIASIAFGEPEPAVDGNVMRVLMRLQASDRDVMDQKNRRQTSAALKEVYPQGEEAALLTEGLMELGERICLPNGQPLCGACPEADLCLAHAAGEELRYPVRSAKKERRVEQKTVLLLENDGCWALQKRPADGLLAGLWGFPTEDGSLSETQIIQKLRAAGLQPRKAAFCGKAKHIFTHIEWHMQGWHVPCGKRTEDYVWTAPEEIAAVYSIPAAFRAFRKIVTE